MFAAARAAYDSPGRVYHTWDHVLDCVAKLDGFACEAPRAAFLALLFHDAVYVAGRKDNEALSAALAADALRRHAQLPQDEIRAVERMIIATSDHRLPAGERGGDTSVVLDIDMSILGEPWQRYRQYADGVRAEYVPAAASALRFAAGRKMFLARLIASSRIFHTPEGGARWEQAARANIARELTALGAPA